MSKIGKLPIQIPSGVTVTNNSGTVEVVGPKGKLSFVVDKNIKIDIKDNLITLFTDSELKTVKSMWGTTRKLISNMVVGVTEGWSKRLEIIGTGYRAEVQGKTLVLTVGYSHQIKIDAPVGITFKVEKNVIIVDGIDRGVVGQVSANIRATRPPEPYKGKGIKYIDEVIRRKAGKAAKAAA